MDKNGQTEVVITAVAADVFINLFTFCVCYTTSSNISFAGVDLFIWELSTVWSYQHKSVSQIQSFT